MSLYRINPKLISSHEIGFIDMFFRVCRLHDSSVGRNWLEEQKIIHLTDDELKNQAFLFLEKALVYDRASWTMVSRQIFLLPREGRKYQGYFTYYNNGIVENVPLMIRVKDCDDEEEIISQK